MMVAGYSHTFAYMDLGGGPSPALQLRVGAPGGEVLIDVDAYLDSGASASLFSGDILQGIDLDLLAGKLKRYHSTFGAGIEARLHLVRLSHEQLGSFVLEVGFSTEPISRNLLGRDFFDRIQIGFREHQSAFFVEPSP